MKKQKILMLTMCCPFPGNYGGKIGTLSNLRVLSEHFEIYLCGLFEKDDFLDEKQLSEYCKEFRFFPRNKSYFRAVLHSLKPFPFVTRENKELKKYIKMTIEKNQIRYVFVDTLFMIDNLPKTNTGFYTIVNEQNLEFEAMKSISKSKPFPLNLIYRYESCLTKKVELTLMSSKKVSAITFISPSELNEYCELTHCDKRRTFYLPTIYELPNKTDDEPILSDVLLLANYKYSPNRYGLFWFIDNCIPLIERNRKNLKIFVIGRGLTEKDKEYIRSKSKMVFPIGEVDSVAPYYQGTKAVAIPLFHGGGVKVKLLEAVSYNRSIVCTTKVLEGTRFSDCSMMVADEPGEFSSLLLKSLTDQKENESKMKKAKKIFDEDYNMTRVGGNLHAFITNLDDEKKQ